MQYVLGQIDTAWPVQLLVDQVGEGCAYACLELGQLVVELGCGLLGRSTEVLLHISFGRNLIHFLEKIFRRGAHEEIYHIVLTLIFAYALVVDPCVGDVGRVVAAAVGQMRQQLLCGLASVDASQRCGIVHDLADAEACRPCFLAGNVHDTVGNVLGYVVGCGCGCHAQLSGRGDQSQRYHLAETVDIGEYVVACVLVVDEVHGCEGARVHALHRVEPFYLHLLRLGVEVGEEIHVYQRAERVCTHATHAGALRHGAEDIAHDGVADFAFSF